MTSLAVSDSVLPPATEAILQKIAIAESRVRECPQINPEMEHILHGGMYARTCRLAANVVIVSVLVKVPTVVIVSGSCYVLAGEKWHTLDGYNVMAASGGRKQIYVTRTNTEITMLFPTNAKTLEEAESEMTDESDNLLSRRQDGNNLVTVTGA
jgi:hypothetical protein